MGTGELQKVCVVTGGSSGIGFALAERFLKAGWKVAVCGRNEERLKSAVEKMEDPDSTFARVVDVSIENEALGFIHDVANHFGRIDVLINNAGISMNSRFAETKLEVFKKIMDINLMGMVYCTHAALPYLRMNRGTVAGISSIAGYRALPGRTAYSASKFSMNGFLESLRVEEMDNGVNVLTICPGFTASNIRYNALKGDGKRQKVNIAMKSKMMSASEVAEKSFRAVINRRRQLILTTKGRITVFLNRWLPAWVDNLVKRYF